MLANIKKVSIMDQLKNNFTVEQEFNHRLFCDHVRQITLKQAQELLMEMHQHMLLKDNLYKDLFLNQEKEFVDSIFDGKKS